MVITKKARLAYYASVVALLVSVAFGSQHAKPVRIGDAIKITRPAPVQVADAYKVTR